MSSTGKRAFVVVGVVLVLFGLWFTDNFVYPLRAESPNYSDVERAFAKLQFQAGWTQIDSSQNKGMFGRGCDMFNDSGCFHKSLTFKVPDVEAAKVTLKAQFMSNGCKGILDEATYEGNSNVSPKTLTSLSCQLDGGAIYYASASLQRGEVSVGARTY